MSWVNCIELRQLGLVALNEMDGMSSRASVGANKELSQVGHLDSTPILISELKIADVVQTNDIKNLKKKKQRRTPMHGKGIL